MQNFVYKGDASPAARRRDQELVTRLAHRVRQDSEAAAAAEATGTATAAASVSAPDASAR